MSRRVLPWAVVLTLLSLSSLYGVAPLFSPQALPATAPADQYSATRALPHIKEISQEVHPAGSSAMVDVATYLSESLKQIVI